MKFNQPLYYCTECKTVVPALEQLLFIEEDSNKGFCSDTCIEDFYLPLIRHFESLELALRKRLNLPENEEIDAGFDDKELVEEVLKNPSEVWAVENLLQEKISTYIRHYNDFSAVIMCTVYNGEASFIFLCTKTRSRAFLSELRSGNKENASSMDEEVPLDDEDFNFIQSKLLADLLMKRKDDDISFEDFSLYENCFQECLDQPDEVFESKDREGDVFFVYIKSFIKDHTNFFYIISCLKRKDNEESSEVNVFPVLAFPTNDMDLYAEFREGSRIAGTLRN